MKEIIYSCINSFWGGILLRITKPLFFLAGKKQKWHKYKSYRFLWSYSKEKLEKKAQNPTARYVVINKGSYNYNYFNVAFLHNMLSSVVCVLEKGHFPVVQLKDRKEGWINWDTYFIQPFITDKNISNLPAYAEEDGNIKPWFDTPFNKHELKLWSKVYRDFVVFNEQTKAYIDNEYRQIIEPHKRVLGVLYRGTDYLKLQPKGHPVQPTVDELIREVEDRMKEMKFDRIYLATEERRVVDVFERAFPGRILVNKRKYYDDAFYRNDFELIGQVVFDRENDDILKGLEYLSSIYLLSRCTSLIAGNAGGSCAALYMNNLNYEYWKLFELGYYGVE